MAAGSHNHDTSTLCDEADSYERDDLYYLRDIVFLVQKTLFRVPRALFEDTSPVFEGMFGIPPPPGIPVDGSDDTHPLRLDGIEKADFRRLLRVLMPLHTPTAQPSLDTNGWLSVLKLATLWEFSDARNAAIKALDAQSISTVDKLVYARQYEVKSWLEAGLIKLVMRTSSLTLEEGERLGMAWMVKLAAVRETVAPEREPLIVPTGNRFSVLEEVLMDQSTPPSFSFALPSSERTQRRRAPFGGWGIHDSTKAAFAVAVERNVRKAFAEELGIGA